MQIANPEDVVLDCVTWAAILTLVVVLIASLV